MEQPKIEAILRLISLLIGNRRSTNELAELFGCDTRTLQRYISTLKCAGFVVEYRSRGVPFLSIADSKLKTISDLVHFSEEEAYILHKAIDCIDDSTALKQNLKNKLYSIYNYPWLADVIVKPQQGAIVHALIEAIEEKRCVVLKNYRSSNSNSVADRLVEPYKFTTNYQQVWCYEPSSGACKLFKLARIGAVEISLHEWSFEKKHLDTYIDVFRIAGTKNIGKAELKLNMRAYNLLVEEYPLAEQYVNCQSNNSFIFSAPLCSYEGVARFVLGLYADIQVLGDANLKTFISEKIFSLKNLNDNN